MRIVTALILALCLAPCLHAATPNPDKNAPPPDKRLSQKVTIKAIGVPLGDFLKQLSAKTGVKMTARRDVADDKVAVFVKSVPLRDVMEAVRTVLHLRQSESGTPDAREYEFWMDQKDENALDAQTGEDLKNLRKYMDQLAADLKLTPDEIKSRYKNDLASQYTLGDRIDRDLLGLYGGLGKAGADTLWSDKKTSLFGSTLSADVRARLLAAITEREKRFADEYKQYLQRPGKSDEGEPVHTTATTWLSVDSVDFKLNPNNGTTGAELEYWINGTAKLAQRSQDGEDDSTSMSTSSSFHPTAAEEIQRTADSVAMQEEFLAAKTQEELTKLMEKYYGTQKVKLKPVKAWGIYGAYDQLLDLAGVNTIAGFYTFATDEAHLFMLQANEEMPVKFYTQWLASGLNASCVKVGDISACDSRQWFRYRAREIPERLLSKWRRVRGKKGYIGLTEAIEMSALNDQQIEDLQLYGLDDDYEVSSSKKVLRFIAALDSRQYGMLTSEAGLYADALNADQLAQFNFATLSGDIDDPYGTTQAPVPMIESIRLAPEEPDTGKPRKGDRYGLKIMSTGGLEMMTVYLSFGTGEYGSASENRAPQEPVCEISVDGSAKP